MSQICIDAVPTAVLDRATCQMTGYESTLCGIYTFFDPILSFIHLYLIIYYDRRGEDAGRSLTWHIGLEKAGEL